MGTKNILASSLVWPRGLVGLTLQTLRGLRTIMSIHLSEAMAPRKIYKYMNILHF
jgi:hypothetical protein